MAEKEENTNLEWYVVHTYSGYENKVKANLEMTVQNRGMQDLIAEVKVPMEEVIELKDERKRVKQQKVFPGYVMVKMVMNDETWYVVRNTRGVTGFVGPGSKPVPLTPEEVDSIGVEVDPFASDLAVGDRVRILSGPLESFEGVIEELYPSDQKARVVVSMFGRDTPVEMEYTEIRKF